MKWPASICPFHCVILPIINKNDKSKIEIATKMADEFKKKKIDVIIDDTEDSISSKIKKFNLIGIPFQIVIGNNFNHNKIEFSEVGQAPEYKSFQEIVNKINKEILN